MLKVRQIRYTGGCNCGMGFPDIALVQCFPNTEPSVVPHRFGAVRQVPICGSDPISNDTLTGILTFVRRLDEGIDVLAVYDKTSFERAETLAWFLGGTLGWPVDRHHT